MISKEEQYQKKIKAANRAREKAREKARSPEYIERQKQKRAAAIQRQITKQNDPAYRQEQFEKKKRKQAERRNKPANTTSKSNRGLKGRTPRANEKRIQNAVGTMPCIACLAHGRVRLLTSLHHIDGRTSPYAHAKVLPLCAEHHDTPAEKEIIKAYPDLIPIHARGTLGGKSAWEKINGSQEELLAITYALLELEPPFELMTISDERLEFFSVAL